MRNQEFHEGVDGLKSLGTPDLDASPNNKSILEVNRWILSVIFY